MVNGWNAFAEVPGWIEGSKFVMTYNSSSPVSARCNGIVHLWDDIVLVHKYRLNSYTL